MTRPATPNRQWQDVMTFFDSQLFIDVQCAGLFPDSKTFADASPNRPLSEILSEYDTVCEKSDFDLNEFVKRHFTIPSPVDVRLNDNETLSVNKYINRMWDVLTKPADTGNDYSLFPLPHPYIVPGGRFREVYYWDTFFSALGLAVSNKTGLIHDLIKNFLVIQSEFGCIPNGNRLYYATRSQPPVLALMGRFVSEDNQQLKASLLTGLQREYHFWMQRQTEHREAASFRNVMLENGVVLNRYFDINESPRPESYREDKHLAEDLATEDKGKFYQHIRAACESGWDFSSRWLQDPQSLSSIRTCEIIPVDLNCLLYHLEVTLAQQSEGEKAEVYLNNANTRAAAILQYCWSDKHSYYVDYHFPSRQQTDVISLAGVMPLYVGLATPDQATLVAEKLQDHFLCEGGLVTTLNTTSQQWDAPNGWAPLQWFAVKGLQRYGFETLAQTVMQRWNALIEKHYTSQGVILEKYNVVTPGSAVGGGEYEVQLGFGWSNGVYQDFSQMLNQKK